MNQWLRFGNYFGLKSIEAGDITHYNETEYLLLCNSSENTWIISEADLANQTFKKVLSVGLFVLLFWIFIAANFRAVIKFAS